MLCPARAAQPALLLMLQWLLLVCPAPALAMKGTRGGGSIGGSFPGTQCASGRHCHCRCGPARRFSAAGLLPTRISVPAARHDDARGSRQFDLQHVCVSPRHAWRCALRRRHRQRRRRDRRRARQRCALYGSPCTLVSRMVLISASRAAMPVRLSSPVRLARDRCERAV